MNDLPPEGGWTQPSLFKIDDSINTDVSTHWFFGDATEFQTPAWTPSSLDEFWLRSMGIDPI